MTDMQLLGKLTLEMANVAGHDCKTSEDKQCLACYDLWELGQILERIEQAKLQTTNKY